MSWGIESFDRANLPVKMLVLLMEDKHAVVGDGEERAGGF
jgi:hypothetical protein